MVVSLGIHIGHDGGAAICRDGEVEVACHEERLTRVKYANGWWNAVRYCLGAANLRIDDCDIIVFSNAGGRLPSSFNGGLDRWCMHLPPTLVVDHHESHAVGAFCFSSFSECLAFVGDAGGNDGMTESVYVMDDRRWERCGGSGSARPRAKGLGTTYEAFTNFLGFRDQESGKTMALAAFGDPEAFKDITLFDVSGDGHISSRLEHAHHWGVDAFSSLHSGRLGKPFPDSRCGRAADIAAYVQREFVKTLEQAVKITQMRTGLCNVVLSGGIGLNCVANQVLQRSLGANFYAFPACSDAGLALGNAFLGHCKLEGRLPKPADRSLRYGRVYDEEEISLALARHPDTVPPGSMRLGELAWTRSERPALEAARRVADGAVVAWWQGRSETGPRALGGRSILAAPNAGTREHINAKVKMREWFRPLAPSVSPALAEIILAEPGDYPHMNMAPVVNQRGSELIPDAVHVDQTARVQTVTHDYAPELSELLSELGQLGKTEGVINTSFNIQEPIVETPGDAISTFLRSDIDVLVLDQYICERTRP